MGVQVRELLGDGPGGAGRLVASLHERRPSTNGSAMEAGSNAYSAVWGPPGHEALQVRSQHLSMHQVVWETCRPTT